MKLKQLLQNVTTSPYDGVDIHQIQQDSRKIKPGDVFLAYPGYTVDGRQFMKQAEALGAAAIVYDVVDFTPPTLNIPLIGVPQLRDKIGHIAANFFQHPADALHLIGITGTNGKTTIAYQLAQAYQRLGHASAYIGTIGEGAIDAIEAGINTTPDGFMLQHLFNNYRQQAINTVCMEVSSHALSQRRVASVPYKEAIFTNLTHEHLDFHHTMDEYAAAKAMLFQFESLELAIINIDDAYASLMTERLPSRCQLISYGIKQECQVRASDIRMTMCGTTYMLHSPWGSAEVYTPLIGYFNVYNSLAIAASLLAKSISLDQLVALMKQLKAAPGRMELVSTRPCVVVDYAHTPDALENVLRVLKELTRGKLIVVFGAGGDRDSEKRPLMGKLAAQYADVVWITSDNPRTENPLNIIDAIKQGIPALLNTQVHTEEDRARAIEDALRMTGEQDILVIAGKGHEEYQEIHGVRHHFSDREQVLHHLIEP